MKYGYARVSTTDQTLALQLDALLGCGCDEIVEEHGVSGLSRSRPSLEKLLGRLQSGDVLVVWRLDRLGRSLAHLIDILHLLGGRGVAFVSQRENIDTNTASGRLIFHIMAALAQFESDLISERTKAGMQAAQKRGRRIGRRRAMTADHVLKANEMLLEGYSMSQVGRFFRCSEASVRRAFEREGIKAIATSRGGKLGQQQLVLAQELGREGRSVAEISQFMRVSKIAVKRALMLEEYATDA